MNGIQSIFKVYPVQMVARMPKLKKESNRSDKRRSNLRQSHSFEDLLEETFLENGPAECYMVTYTADSKLQTYSCRTREYTF